MGDGNDKYRQRCHGIPPDLTHALFYDVCHRQAVCNVNPQKAAVVKMGGFDYHVIPSEYIGVDGLAGPSSYVRQHQSGMVERPRSAYQRPALVSAFDGAGE